jgi:hypothetical protein
MNVVLIEGRANLGRFPNPVKTCFLSTRQVVEMAARICQTLKRRLLRLEGRLPPMPSVIWVVFTSEGNLASVALSNGERLVGESATGAYQAISRTQPCKVYLGFDPYAALRGEQPRSNGHAPEDETAAA